MCSEDESNIQTSRLLDHCSRHKNGEDRHRQLWKECPWPVTRADTERNWTWTLEETKRAGKKSKRANAGAKVMQTTTRSRVTTKRDTCDTKTERTGIGSFGRSVHGQLPGRIWRGIGRGLCRRRREPAKRVSGQRQGQRRCAQQQRSRVTTKRDTCRQAIERPTN